MELRPTGLGRAPGCPVVSTFLPAVENVAYVHRAALTTARRRNAMLFAFDENATAKVRSPDGRSV